MRVVIWSNIGRHMEGWPEAFQLFEDAGYGVVDPGAEGLTDERAALLADADATIVGTNPVTRAMLEAAPRLKVIAKPGVGVDNVDLAAATELGIRVCNTPGSNALAVADHALALALAAMRDIVRLDDAVQRGKGWDEWPFIGAQLAGAKVAVLGTGNIGREVVKRLVSGFDATVQAYDPYPDRSLETTYGVQYLPLDEAIQGVDLVFIHVPLVEETRGLIGAREIALMKPGSFLVNASRGGIMDEQAVADAVTSGHLAGAGIDVFAEEPPTSSPLFGLARVVLTPHIAGYSGDASLRSRVISAENIILALDGAPRFQVNVDPSAPWRA